MAESVTTKQNKSGTSFSRFFEKPVLSGAIVFCLIGALLSVIIIQRYNNLKYQEEQQVKQVLESAKSRLQLVLNQSLMTTQSMAFIVKNDGLSFNFDSTAASLLQFNDAIDAIQLVPGGIIQYVYPLQGNEMVIGYDLLKDPLRNKEAFKAIDDRKLFFAGPLKLIQGGYGVVGRLPVFIDNKFWGFSAVVIKFPTLLKSAGIDTSGTGGYHYQLSKISPVTGKEEFFLPGHKMAAEKSTSVLVPDGEWKLSVIPVTGYLEIKNILTLLVLSTTLTILAAWVAFSLAKKPKQLENLVAEKSAELVKSNKRNLAIVNAIPDLIFVLNEKGIFVDYSNSHKNPTLKSPKNFIGKTVSEVMPPEIALQTLTNISKVIHTKDVLVHSYQLEDESSIQYYEATYSFINKTEVLVIVRNVTERVLGEMKVKNSEEKLWQVLSSIGDVFYVIDLNYRVILINEIAEGGLEKAWGKPVRIGTNLLEVIPKEKNEPIINSLEKAFKGEYVEYEHSNSVESLPSWMLVTYSPIMDQEDTITGIAIISKDISKRKKAEEDLLHSYKRFELITRTTNDAIWEWNLETGHLWGNENHQRLYGLTLNDPIPVEYSWVNRIHPDDRERMVDRQKKVLTSSDNVFISEYRFYTEAKGYVDIYDRCYIVRNDEGKAILMTGSMMDITERKKTEEEIIKTNARFNIVSQATSDIVWDWDLKTDFIWWNDNYYSKLGYKKVAEAIPIINWFNCIHPQDADRVKSNINKALEGKNFGWRDEYRFVDANGMYLNFLDRGFIIRDKEGHATRMIGSMVDMTPIYKAQRKVAESENRLRTILDTDPECIKLLGPGCELYEINLAGLKMLEIDDFNLIKGKSILNVVAVAQRKAVEELVKKAFANEAGNLEYEMETFKGKKRWCEISVVPFKNEKGEIINALGLTKDISARKITETELKRSEVKYRTLVEQAVDGIVLYDKQGKILDVNTGAALLSGYTKNELMGMLLSDVLLEEGADVNPVMFDVLQDGKSTIRQRRMKRKDGSTIETEVRSQQLPDERFLSVIRDMTERIRKEKELEASYKSIRNLTAHLQNIREEERTHIAREIHDELGQQLTVLKMDIAWLNKKIEKRDKPIDEKMQQLLAMIDETVKSVRRISSSLRPSLLDDLGLVAAMEWQLSEFEKRSGIKTELISAETELKLTNTVKTALFRIFQESLTNVARHSNAKSISVLLEHINNTIVLSIIDDGKGFDQQVISEKKTLGILGMNERTTMIGGGYKIISSPGNGTKVSVSVPVHNNE